MRNFRRIRPIPYSLIPIPYSLIPVPGSWPTAAPTLLFVALGVALGPYGLNILTAAVLSRAQAVAWVALAVIGVFVGLALAAESQNEPERHHLEDVAPAQAGLLLELREEGRLDVHDAVAARPPRLDPARGDQLPRAAVLGHVGGPAP